MPGTSSTSTRSSASSRRDRPLEHEAANRGWRSPTSPWPLARRPPGPRRWRRRPRRRWRPTRTARRRRPGRRRARRPGGGGCAASSGRGWRGGRRRRPWSGRGRRGRARRRRRGAGPVRGRPAHAQTPEVSGAGRGPTGPTTCTMPPCSTSARPVLRVHRHVGRLDAELQRQLQALLVGEVPGQACAELGSEYPAMSGRPSGSVNCWSSWPRMRIDLLVGWARRAPRRRRRPRRGRPRRARPGRRASTEHECGPARTRSGATARRRRGRTSAGPPGRCRRRRWPAARPGSTPTSSTSSARSVLDIGPRRPPSPPACRRWSGRRARRHRRTPRRAGSGRAARRAGGGGGGWCARRPMLGAAPGGAWNRYSGGSRWRRKVTRSAVGSAPLAIGTSSRPLSGLWTAFGAMRLRRVCLAGLQRHRAEAGLVGRAHEAVARGRR